MSNKHNNTDRLADPASPGIPAVEAALYEASKSGFSNVEYDGKTLTIVRPGLTLETGVQPFVGKEWFIPIQLKRAAYSDRTAWVMAELSQLAYTKFEDGKEQENVLVKALADAAFVRLHLFNSDYGTQGFLAVRLGEYAVLAFRGTETNKSDIMADLNARFLQTPDGKAHRGFAKAFEAVERDVRKRLDELYADSPDMPIFITGHSLGGAIATAATQVLEQDYTVAACYTFGGPRVGTAEWSDKVKSPMYRVVNGADGVPMVPFSSVFKDGVIFLTKIPLLHFAEPYVRKLFESGFAGFQHAGDMRFILDGDPALLKMGSSAVFMRFRHIVLGLMSRFFFWTGKPLGVRKLSAFFSDHSIGRYAEILKSIAEQRNPDQS